jgi:hypothetical protein
VLSIELHCAQREISLWGSIVSWWETVPAFLVVLTLGLVPGLLISFILGLRGIAVLGSAPAFSVSSITLASLAAPFLGIRWGLTPIAVTTLVLLAIVVVFRVFWHRFRPQPKFANPPTRLLIWAALGVGVAATVITVRFVIVFGQPENISQTYDNIFHLNALRYVLDTGNASSLTLGGLNLANPGTGTFYPAGWHALTAAAVSITGVSIPVAINLVSILVGAIYWPLSCVLLVRTIVGPRAIAIVGAGVLSAAFGAFPYGLIDFGVVYPYLLAVSILPAALAFAAVAAGISEHAEMRTSRACFALLGLLPGIMLAHPSVAMAFVAFSAVMIVRGAQLEHRRLIARKASSLRIRIATTIAAAILVGYAAAWLIVRVSVAWQPTRTVAQALGESLTNATNGLPISWMLTLLVAIGVWVLRDRRTEYWILFNFALAVLLYIAAAAMPHSLFRALLVGTWYGDSHRLAALLPIVALPLATIGLVWVYDQVRTREMRRVSRSGHRSRAQAIITVSLLLVATQGYSVHVAMIDAQSNYIVPEFSNEAALLTSDERAVLEHVDEYVPEGAVVAGNPWTGASLVYAIANRRAMLPHVGGFDTPQSKLIGKHLRDADRFTSVCDALAVLKIAYALDFGSREVHSGEHDFGGLTDLATSTAVRPLYIRGDVGLYKITACG